ncbi:hypothetical protein CLV25_101369 [Acetobacteroides hydrogenigenes]|uniref:Uncharacterized protein n=1 Tax=Acetobacteroides hydrogenigenes TaxID=979970 RepID=A0A4R2F7B2_9BACT|nr:hypothetical protein CLV25_101369 [Acetobacteroides hydrogenigenes]
MKYLNEILWLLSLPLLIYISYKLSELAIKKHKKIEKE